MILVDNFYFIRDFEAGDRSAKALLEFDGGHSIFAGHFPTVPVVPGVCMMQIVKEFVEKLTGTKTNIHKVALMKFLTLINPRQVPVVRIDASYVETSDSSFQVTASLYNEGVVYFKFKGTLVPAFDV